MKPDRWPAMQIISKKPAGQTFTVYVIPNSERVDPPLSI